MKIFRDYSSRNNRDYQKIQKKHELILANLVKNSDGQIKTDYHENVFVEVKKLFGEKTKEIPIKREYIQTGNLITPKSVRKNYFNDVKENFHNSNYSTSDKVRYVATYAIASPLLLPIFSINYLGETIIEKSRIKRITPATQN